MPRPHQYSRRLFLLLPLLTLACDSVAITPVGVARLEIAPSSIEVVVGGTIQLRASALGASGGTIPLGTASWTTSDSSIALVDGNGMLTGLSVGVAAVTVSANGIAASAPVNVRAAGALAISDSLVAFEADQGGPDPAPVVLTIGDSGAASQGLSAQVVHAAGQPFGWLLATLSATNGPADLRLEARVGGLPAGQYDADVRVASQSTSQVSNVRVVLTIADPNPSISVNQDTVRFTGADQTTLQVNNGGGGTLSGLTTRVRYVGGGSTWLQVSLASSVAPTTLALTSVPTGLPAGSYLGFVDILSTVPGVTTATIPVVLEVGNAVPVLRLTPARIDLIHQVGGTAPTATVQIDDPGGSTISGLTKAVSYAPNEPTGWLNTTLSATVTPAALSLETIPGSLAVGTYTASVEVGGSGTTPKILPVTLTVTAAAPTAPAAPSGLTASAGSPTTVDLGWTDNSGNETTFEIERASAGGSFVAVATVGINATTFADSGLTEGTRYEYRVRACNGVGCSPYSNTAGVVTPVSVPAAPDGLTATVSTSAVALNWTDNSSNETTFEVERAAAGAGFTPLAILSANTSSYSDTSTSAGTSYEYRVRACNAAGCSAYSNVASATTPAAVPTAPTALVGTVTGSDVELTWTDNSSNETAFEVERATTGGSFTTLAALGANTSSYTDNSVVSGTTYEYRVRACNGAGCSTYSNVVSVTTPAVAPNAPTALVGTASGATVDLSWTDNSNNETSFDIQRTVAGGTFADYGSTPTDVNRFTDASVTAGTTYEYRVTACNAAGCSAYSNVVSITVPAAVPAAPSGLTATPAGSTEVDLTWTDNSATETSFEIERSSSGGSFASIGTAPADATTFTDNTVSSGVSYSYRVAACNATGCSAYSNTASATVPTSAPPRPSSLRATVLSATDVDLAWPDVAGETSYEIQQRIGSGSYQNLATVGANAVTYRVAGLAPGTEYRFRIRACNAGGCSGRRASNTVQTQNPTTVPADPTGITFISTSPTQIVLGWTDTSSDETHFVIEEGDLFGPWLAIGQVGVNVTTFTDTAVRRGFAIYYRVIACNPVGCSSPSVPINITIP